MAFEAVPPSNTVTSPLTIATVIARIAHFEWEIPRTEQETRAYQLLEESGLAPRFLDHVHENGRTMGFLLEKVEDVPLPSKIWICVKQRWEKLHGMGFVHGDVNLYNFLITNEGVQLLDFEHLVENASPELILKELENVRAELIIQSVAGVLFSMVTATDHVET